VLKYDSGTYEMDFFDGNTIRNLQNGQDSFSENAGK